MDQHMLPISITECLKVYKMIYTLIEDRIVNSVDRLIIF